MTDHADDHLDDLLSEVWHADTLANNPRTREFLDAGEELLHSGLARDPGEATSDAERGKFRAPFDELLAWVSRRRVVAQAAQAAHAGQKRDENGVPSESAYRYRWRTQSGYLRDLVIYALRHRMASPEETQKAADALFSTAPLDAAIAKIAYDEVRSLNEDKAFRLQMVFQATLAHDDHVAPALRRIDRTNVRAWRAFYQQAIDHFGLRLRPDVTVDDLAYALQSAAEGVVFRSLLPQKDNCPPAALALDHNSQTARPLAMIAMALLVAFTDPGDGKELTEAVRELGQS
jgi:hypothetical protein